MCFKLWLAVNTILPFFLTVVSVDFVSQGENCLQKNGNIGICIPLSQCQSALLQLQVDKLNPMLCGFENGVALVCCPKDIATVTTTPEPDLSSIDTSKTGNIARYYCQQYAKSVYKITPDAGLSFENTNRNESQCGLENGDGFIIGGIDAKLGEFPHVVAIGYGEEDNIQWECSGSLISEQWILSAAHCISSRINGLAKFARIGFVDFTSSKGQNLKIIDRIKYPSYVPLISYSDISLMKLERHVEFSADLRPACLQYTQRKTEKKAFAAGWGKTHWQNSGSSTSLKKVILDIYSKGVCDKYYAGNAVLPLGFDINSQLCIGAVEGGRDTCGGDSGSSITLINPDVYCMHEIIGITSVGSKFCGTMEQAGLYTRVEHFIDWIEKIVWKENFKKKTNRVLG